MHYASMDGKNKPKIQYVGFGKHCCRNRVSLMSGNHDQLNELSYFSVWPDWRVLLIMSEQCGR